MLKNLINIKSYNREVTAIKGDKTMETKPRLGRPPMLNKQMCSFTLTTDEVQKLNKLSEVTKKSKSEILRGLITEASKKL